MSFSALATGQQPQAPSSGGKDSVLSRGAHNRHSSWGGSARSGGVFSEDEPLPEPQPVRHPAAPVTVANEQLTVENLSLFSQQSPKPLAFLPPNKRPKAKGKAKDKTGKKDKEKGKGKGNEKEKAKEGKSDKPVMLDKVDKGKGKATNEELDALFDNSKFDLLQALENVDRFRAEGPGADNIAHMRTLAMLSAATGGALNNFNVPEQKDANTSGENSGDAGEAGGDADTLGETGDKRRMHNSFHTTTTESFGHIYHRDGRPVPPPNAGPSGRFSHHRHHSSGGALADISEATESRDAKHQVTTVEDVPDVSSLTPSKLTPGRPALSAGATRRSGSRRTGQRRSASSSSAAGGHRTSAPSQPRGARAQDTRPRARDSASRCTPATHNARVRGQLLIHETAGAAGPFLVPRRGAVPTSRRDPQPPHWRGGAEGANTCCQSPRHRAQGHEGTRRGESDGTCYEEQRALTNRRR